MITVTIRDQLDAISGLSEYWWGFYTLGNVVTPVLCSWSVELLKLGLQSCLCQAASLIGNTTWHMEMGDYIHAREIHVYDNVAIARIGA